MFTPPSRDTSQTIKDHGKSMPSPDQCRLDQETVHVCICTQLPWELLSSTAGHAALWIPQAVTVHAAAMFLIGPALGLAQMCLQLHNHLFQGT